MGRFRFCLRNVLTFETRGVLSELVSMFRPDRIFHLAAPELPQRYRSLRPREETMDINVGGTINLFECLACVRMRAQVIVGLLECGVRPRRHPGTCPSKRVMHSLPLHPYGVSKVAQDCLRRNIFANYAIPSIRIRIFNTTGPGKVGDVCSDLTKRAIEIEMGLRPQSLLVGKPHQPSRHRRCP